MIGESSWTQEERRLFIPARNDNAEISSPRVNLFLLGLGHDDLNAAEILDRLSLLDATSCHDCCFMCDKRVTIGT